MRIVPHRRFLFSHVWRIILFRGNLYIVILSAVIAIGRMPVGDDCTARINLC